ncbi:unnamed protein product, partial [Closterium sp. NIES-54]
QGVNGMGLRVVLDVVYNHLYASGPHSPFSVLDKVVPGYYVRRDAEGRVESSACCNNTASEHAMVERLIVDDVLMWATQYKVDGFRFDLMGHLMKHTMVSAAAVIAARTAKSFSFSSHPFSLTSPLLASSPCLLLASSPFFPSAAHPYGEGWDFGEVASNGRGVNGTQANLHGTGIGSSSSSSTALVHTAILLHLPPNIRLPRMLALAPHSDSSSCLSSFFFPIPHPTFTNAALLSSPFCPLPLLQFQRPVPRCSDRGVALRQSTAAGLRLGPPAARVCPVCSHDMSPHVLPTCPMCPMCPIAPMCPHVPPLPPCAPHVPPCAPMCPPCAPMCPHAPPCATIAPMCP